MGQSEVTSSPPGPVFELLGPATEGEMIVRGEMFQVVVDTRSNICPTGPVHPAGVDQSSC